MREVKFDNSQSGLLGNLKRYPDSARYRYTADGQREYKGKKVRYFAGQLRHEIADQLEELASYKMHVAAGRKDSEFRHAPKKNTVFGQYWLEHTPQTFDGQEPQYTPDEMRRLLASLTPEQRRRVEELNMRRPGPPGPAAMDNTGQMVGGL